MEILEIIEDLVRYKDKEIYQIDSQEAIDIMVDSIVTDKPIEINTRDCNHRYIIKYEDGWSSCSEELLYGLYDYYESDINELKRAEAKLIKDTHISLNNDLL